MFTGIIEDIGIVKSISSSEIVIETKLGDIKVGDSVSVNGVCLTAVHILPGVFSADYSPNTDKLTTMSLLKQNSKVNLERALRLSSRLGGHIVSGHVDATAKISSVEKVGGFYKLKFSAGKNITNYCVDKGSIAIDGISLTLAAVNEAGFEIFIIPETFNNTILKLKKAGDFVNVETDVFAKYLEKFSKNKGSEGLTLEMLKNF
ncbi:riboflavin synthase [Endomicrobium proavitum]|uniref:Riboflavin synthase n=1 Tax=Endomicrobium proavitum TaxID=1408281 RepID=A0A0G3WKI8_9BACT|nr:riboflavin synthase [Endomicrobium proavitum]AKL97964.1 riboflavin synthase, alpha subunit [Endomicrobium proavitum]